MMLPGLAMARSIGDDIAATVGVHATPEIKVHDLTERDKFMVVASDGVWEFLSSEDVVEIVKGCAGDADRVWSIYFSYSRFFRHAVSLGRHTLR
mmetsp:Transcript_60560/g.126757  ORF Transcript_60560/g.126757 Transcript_60560/m.126757 type:complete len:94 (+) Transcript_60560:901-1182(+)